MAISEANRPSLERGVSLRKRLKIGFMVANFVVIATSFVSSKWVCLRRKGAEEDCGHRLKTQCLALNPSFPIFIIFLILINHNV